MYLEANPAFIFDVFKLVLFMTCSYAALTACARHAQAPWLLALTGRRFTVLALLTLLVLGLKVFEDVIAKESGPVDKAWLWFIHQNVPAEMTSFFSVVTLSGSGKFLAPLIAVFCGLLLLKRRRREAILLSASVASASVLTYSFKVLIDRTRPDLWSTAWYWGSSFPSGHTLSTTAFATALCLSMARIWPRSRYAAAALAALWVLLVGLSRLVLGVHWPTDVLAAICLGVFIPLAISLVLDLYQYRTTTSR
jgi:undecaprenyl-diphosphatase